MKQIIGHRIFILLLFVISISVAQPQTTEQTQFPHLPRANVSALGESLVQGLEDADEIAEIERITEEAIQNLTSAAEWRERKAEYQRLANSAASMTETIRAEIRQERQEQADILSEADKMSLAQAEQELSRVSADARSVRQRATELETTLNNHLARRTQLPDQIASARQRSNDMRQALSTTSDQAEGRSLLQRYHKLSRFHQANEKYQVYDLEYSSFELKTELIRAQRDQAMRRANRLEEREKAYQQIVNKLRSREADLQAEMARQVLKEASYAQIPEISQLAADNARLAEERITLAETIRLETQAIAKNNSELARISEDYRNIKEKIATTGFSDAIGLLLRIKRSEMRPVSRFNFRARREASQRTQLISQIQFKLIELDEKLSNLSDVDDRIEKIMKSFDPEAPIEYRAEIEQNLANLLKNKHNLVTSLLNDYNVYFNRLVDHDTVATNLQNIKQDYIHFIDERILWIRSCSPFLLREIGHSFKNMHILFSVDNWLSVGKEIIRNLRANPILWFFALLLLTLLYAFCKRSAGILQDLAEKCVKARTDRFSYTLWALLTSVLYSFFYPAIFLVIGYLIQYNEAEHGFARALGLSLLRIAPYIFFLSFVRTLFFEKGLAKIHFNWHFSESFELIRKKLILMMIASLPFFALHALVAEFANDLQRDSLGRLMFMLALIAVSLTLYKLSLPSGPLFQGLSRGSGGLLAYRMRYVVFALNVVFPMLLVVLSAMGYFYTAERLFSRGVASVGFLFGMVMIYYLIFRALFIQRRSLALLQAKERRAERQKEKEKDTASDMSGNTQELSVGGFEEFNISTISTQTQNLVTSLVVILIIVGMWLIWAEVLPAVRILNRVKLWSTQISVVETLTRADGTTVDSAVNRIIAITLADLILALLIMGLTITGKKNIPGFMEFALLQKLPIDAGMRYAIRTLASYVLTAIGFIAGFHMIGIGWDKVQWLVAAVSVGLGFGLQEIFANFVSGLIILFERPMRVGDIVTVGDISGTVSKIEIRATTIISWDRKELIVPNKEFITGRLVNWTLSDTILRMVIKVGVAYGSDVDKVSEILLDVARQNPLVLKDPEPRAVFLAFGDSSLDFELRLFIPNLDNFATLTHDFYSTIYKRFAKEDIEIPFPQRDLHIKSINESFEKSLQRQ